MSKKMIVPVLLALLLGCQPNTKKKDTFSESVISDTLKKDSISSSHWEKDKIVSDKKYVEIVPDTTINQKLFLENENSLSDFYHSPRSLALIERIRESPVIIFGNKNNSEYLLAYQYEGNTENAFSCFEIGYFNDQITLREKTNPTESSDFKTESGIGLGISMEDVIQIKGENYKVEESEGYRIMTYRMDDYGNSSFLKRYNMPGYFIRIALKDDIVRRITFGFDYP
ncbi:hypothetical protein [Sinomicrobium sp. M5D2P9]